MDPGISCFQHCDTKVFCYKLPDNCPVCDKDITNGNLKILPFRYPYPFVKASQYPCAIIIRPTKGDFLNDYINSNDLHIGITTSKGQVIEFDNDGLSTINTSKWNQCLLLYEAEESWHELWNSTLDEIIQENCWTSKYYNEVSYNCYTFVLAFLIKLNYGQLSKFAENNVEFCKNVIIPKTIIAGKYTSIYRELKEKLYVMYKTNCLT